MAAIGTQTPANGSLGTPLKASTHGSNADGATDMRCPDPSAHKTKNTALQDHASAAALYSTNPSRAATRNPLGPDGKLSSASKLSVRCARASRTDPQSQAPQPVSGTHSRTTFRASLRLG